MIRLFARYFSVGIVNTVIHWGVFGAMLNILHINQAISNFAGFFAAVTFSFFANAKFTFNKSPTSQRYLMFVTFMGALALISGYIADLYQIPGLYTLIFFSGTSLVLGFIYSKLVVFN